MKKALAVECVVALWCCGLMVSEQQPPTAPQFRTTTDMVVVDVSVLDRNRRPVRGLGVGDFTLLEDGVPQKISAFQAVELADAEVPSAKWMRRATLDVQSNDTPDGRLVVIYLDERTGSADPFFTQTAKNLAHAIVDQLAPNDVAAVAFVLDHRGTQEFTTDRGRLHQAIDTFAASPYVGVELSVVATMRALAEHLGAIPERRKLLIYVGSGEPFDPEVLSAIETTTLVGSSPGALDAGVLSHPVGQRGLTPVGVSLAGPQLPKDYQRELYDRLLELFRSAQRSNVSIYALDPNGLTVQKPGYLGGGDVGEVSRKLSNELLRILAGNTGGRAIVNDNTPTAEVPAILRENSAYYLIGFSPTDLRSLGRFRSIQVKVNRPNVEVRARRGYVEAKATTSAGPAIAPTQGGRILAAAGVSLKLAAIPLGPDGQGSNYVGLAISALVPGREVAGTEHVSVSYSILDMGGQEHASGRRDFALASRDGLGDSPRVEMLALAQLPPGRYDVRVSAKGTESARVGELIGDVVVPDFRKDRLSASGIVVEETPAPKALPVDALAVILSGIPTVSRVFTASSHVDTLLCIYQSAGTPAAEVTVKASIIGGRDQVVFETAERLDASRFAKEFAEYRLTLPLAKLAHGTYLLRLDVSRSSAPVVRREVQFEVK